MEMFQGAFGKHDVSGIQQHAAQAAAPALGALAYTQGSNIHVGPGQEQHLPHEAWHVAQQKEGRVAPAAQLAAAAAFDGQF